MLRLKQSIYRPLVLKVSCLCGQLLPHEKKLPGNYMLNGLFSLLSQAPSTQSRFHGETAKVLYGSAFRPHEAGESADRNRKLLKPPSEVVSNLPGFVLDSCVRLKPTETANHDVIAPPLDLLANGS